MPEEIAVVVSLWLYRPRRLREKTHGVTPISQISGNPIASAAEPAGSELVHVDAFSRQLDRRFRSVVESISDYGVFMLDQSGRVVSWNQGAERISGYKSAEIIGKHFSCFYMPEDIASLKPARELAIAASTGRYAEEGWRVRKDGSLFQASVVISPVRGRDGSVLGFSKVTQDLTAAKEIEHKLAEVNLLKQTILESAPYSIIATEVDGTIRAFNPAAERMLWFKASDVIGKISIMMLHDLQEIAIHAEELNTEFGESMQSGFQVLSHKALLGLTDEREWDYIRKDGSRFPVNLSVTALRDSAGLVSGYLNIAYDVSERRRREEYIQHVATHDFLTGLPNRLLLGDRLTMAIEQGRRLNQKVAVLLLDLDHFKRVNDSRGHHVGDELLKQVAERIKVGIRAVDTVARMGGDEFVVILTPVKTIEDAERLAKTIIDRVAWPIQVGTHELSVTPSIGISCYPDDGIDANTLLKNADTAMYRAKAAGHASFCTFNIDMSRQAQHRLDMEHAMQRALKNDEFKLYYQPQVSLESGEVIGMEALLRWTDPDLGTVSPEEFIPVAEECGLIVPLGEWVLRHACSDGRDIQQRTGRPLRLAVNLSARQFRHKEFFSVISSALQDSGLPPGDLELEITESLLMSDTDEVISRLWDIHHLGVTIAIDDFGVGFSSLSYITRFPIDALKIDRCFISKLPDSVSDAAVTQAIIALAASLGIRVIAEGVENQQQLDFLRERNVEAAQGIYLGHRTTASNFSIQGWCFSKALSAESFISTISLNCRREDFNQSRR